jgi:outer membrane protein TolC
MVVPLECAAQTEPQRSIPVTGILVTKAKVARTRGLHVEAMAKYRQSVLGAIQDVETSLSQILQAAQVQAQRLISTVRLIKALGGSW